LALAQAAVVFGPAEEVWWELVGMDDDHDPAGPGGRAANISAARAASDPS
jgi:hypothetical protein